MKAQIRRPVVVVGILLIAAGYVATKEWEWQGGADPLPLLRVSQIDRGDAGSPRDGTWRAEALTVRPEQIFQD